MIASAELALNLPSVSAESVQTSDLLRQNRPARREHFDAPGESAYKKLSGFAWLTHGVLLAAGTVGPDTEVAGKEVGAALVDPIEGAPELGP